MKRVLAALLLATCATDPLSAAERSTAVAEVALTDAMLALGEEGAERGEVWRAVRLLDLAVCNEPENGTAWHWLGVALAQMGQYDEAVDALTTSLVQSNLPEAEVVRAWKDLHQAKSYVEDRAKRVELEMGQGLPPKRYLGPARSGRMTVAVVRLNDPFLGTAAEGLMLASDVEAQSLGKLARAVGTVQARPDSTPQMRIGQTVKNGMEVSTQRESVAKFALIDPGQKKTCGALTLGPESRFRFDDREPCSPSLKLLAGAIRAAFVPTLADEEVQALLGVRPHKVQIDTQSTHIDISGSDVYISFEPETRITSVYVHEGYADVRAVAAPPQSEAKVRVYAGTMTAVPGDGKPPIPPQQVPGTSSPSPKRPGWEPPLIGPRVKRSEGLSQRRLCGATTKPPH